MRLFAVVVQVEQTKEVDGPIMSKLPKVLKPPKGEIYHEIETSKGIFRYYIVSNGSNKPYRMHVCRPSFNLFADVCFYKSAHLIHCLPAFRNERRHKRKAMHHSFSNI